MRKKGGGKGALAHLPNCFRHFSKNSMILGKKYVFALPLGNKVWGRPWTNLTHCLQNSQSHQHFKSNFSAYFLEVKSMHINFKHKLLYVKAALKKISISDS